VKAFNFPDAYIEQIELVWSKEWTWTSLLYVITRYSVFLDLSLRLVGASNTLRSRCSWLVND
jgi:hypothetical protein